MVEGRNTCATLSFFEGRMTFKNGKDRRVDLIEGGKSTLKQGQADEAGNLEHKRIGPKGAPLNILKTGEEALRAEGETF